MKQYIKDITIKFVPLLMAGIICLLIVNKSIFLHVHILNDGSIIEHAHPYDKSQDSKPYKSHHHSKAQFLFFQNLNILFFIVFLTFALIVSFKKEKATFELIIKHTQNYLTLRKGRAPPIA